MGALGAHFVQPAGCLCIGVVRIGASRIGAIWIGAIRIGAIQGMFSDVTLSSNFMATVRSSEPDNFNRVEVWLFGGLGAAFTCIFRMDFDKARNQNTVSRSITFDNRSSKNSQDPYEGTPLFLVRRVSSGDLFNHNGYG